LFPWREGATSYPATVAVRYFDALLQQHAASTSNMTSPDLGFFAEPHSAFSGHS
jgi:hypothetical protein